MNIVVQTRIEGSRVVVRAKLGDEETTAEFAPDEFREAGLENRRRLNEWASGDLRETVAAKVEDAVGGTAADILRRGWPRPVSFVRRAAAIGVAILVAALAGFVVGRATSPRPADSAVQTAVGHEVLTDVEEVRFWSREALIGWCRSMRGSSNAGMALAFDRCRVEGIREGIVKATLIAAHGRRRPDGTERPQVIAAMQYLFAFDASIAEATITEIAPGMGLDAPLVLQSYKEVFAP